MSASYAVDLGGTCHIIPSFNTLANATASGQVNGLSGVAVGLIADMRDSDSYTNVYFDAMSVTSGPLLIGVQTADVTTSGDFTDPTSGLPQMPSAFSSGGWLRIGQSGTNPGTFNAGNGVSGQFLLSGIAGCAAFLRPHRYARLIFGSGFFDGRLAAGFIGQYRTTGSGGGYSPNPSSGVVSV